jgi:hypothetical protein
MTARIALWTSVLREAKRELEAATSRVALDRAVWKLMPASETQAVAGEGSGVRAQNLGSDSGIGRGAGGLSQGAPLGRKRP